jgi:hypothetical protein
MKKIFMFVVAGFISGEIYASDPLAGVDPHKQGTQVIHREDISVPYRLTSETEFSSKGKLAKTPNKAKKIKKLSKKEQFFYSMKK